MSKRDIRRGILKWRKRIKANKGRKPNCGRRVGKS